MKPNNNNISLRERSQHCQVGDLRMSYNNKYLLLPRLSLPLFASVTFLILKPRANGPHGLYKTPPGSPVCLTDAHQRAAPGCRVYISLSFLCHCDDTCLPGGARTYSRMLRRVRVNSCPSYSNVTSERKRSYKHL